MTPTTTLMMFAKAPIAGAVKTRLIPLVGAELAARLHQAFIRDMLEVSLAWASVRSTPQHPVRLVLATAGDPDHEVFEHARAQGLECWPQGDGDLGQRLSRMSARAFDEGTSSLIITGSDSPTLSPMHYQECMQRLEQGAQVVFGPSFDGGYYMVAMRGPYVRIFEQIPWSDEATLAHSLVRAREAGCDLALTQFWYDVDTKDDLKFLWYHLQTYLSQTPELQTFYGQTRQLLATLKAQGVFGDSMN